ncbi:molecular chaperone Skp [Thiocapsa imhoffii]|uniref:Molecular chaperone Skp n=1 Tax=Thiocapsa imhoffii TaxID=382777 RepID=A0A9X0WHP9_9GAMM|nr:OmpH family outer membrane protein [Thiocapsa imhoffii]MBK1644726.1 molecular chaperone Skp [Thiocapsa imhoffii]
MTRSSLALALLVSSILPLEVVATTVGYVDMQQVLEESKVGKRVQEQLRAEFEPRGQALGEEEQAIRQLQMNLERDGPLMSADQVSAQEAEIQTRIEAFQEQANAIQLEVAKAQQEKSREIIIPARDSINAVAKKKKVGVVLEPGMSGLLYVDEALDLTGDVIKDLDAKTP